jgi:hypothetical protein
LVESGFENGCAMPLDVATGVPEGSRWGRVVLNVRRDEEGRRVREERRQRAQIMVGVGLELKMGGVLSVKVWRLFGGVRRPRWSFGEAGVKVKES